MHKIIVAVAVVAGVVAPTSGPVPAGATVKSTDTLSAGHCMTATRTSAPALHSPSGRFVVQLFRNRLEIGNHVKISPHAPAIGHSVWQRGARRDKGRHASLCLRRSGDLVLTVDRKRKWSTHSAGTATYLRVLNSGNVVLRTRSGRTVWSSRTTAAYLRTGDTLGSGRTLTNRLLVGKPPGRLRMTIAGDLQVLRGTKIVWHARTHSRGAVMVLTAQGALTVRARNGQTVWTTRAYGRDAFLSLAPSGSISMSTLHNWYQWIRPATK